MDFVKIDQSLIVSAVEDPKAQAVLMAIIAYARRADAFVIAEGIESERILSFVKQAHELEVMNNRMIDGGQGFILGRPDSDLTKVPRADSPASDLSCPSVAAVPPVSA